MITENLIKEINTNFTSAERNQWLIHRKSKKLMGNDTLEDIYIVNENFEFILLKIWSSINEEKKGLSLLVKQMEDPEFNYDETNPWPTEVEKIRIECGQIIFADDRSQTNIQTSIKRIYNCDSKFELPNIEALLTILKNRKSFL